MSVFDQNNNQEKDQSLLTTLVGEGQKYKTAEELAKGYQNADAHIATLTEELKALKEQSASHQNLTDAVNSKNKSEVEANAKDLPVNVNSLSPDELRDMVSTLLNEDKNHNVQQTNLSQVEEFLTGKFGDKAAEEISKIAFSNGMSLEQLKTLSTTSPQAVITLCGGASGTVHNTGTFQSSVNTLSKPTEVKGNSYFNKLRKDDPKAFYSRAVQNEMRGAIAELGEDFLNH